MHEDQDESRTLHKELFEDIKGHALLLHASSVMLS